MRTTLIFIYFLISVFPQIHAQQPTPHGTTTDRIIESGNLIIEILKVIHSTESGKSKASSSRDADCATKNFTNICFCNKSSQIIVVSLKMKSNGENHELIIANNGKECCYRITPGVYIYSIEQKSPLSAKTELIRKGEVLLEKCRDLEVKIK